MEKICIVKLRKKEAMPDMLWESRSSVRQDMEAGLLKKAPALIAQGIPGNEQSEGDPGLSFTLTQEQTNTLRADPWRLNLLNGEFNAGARGMDSAGRALVVNFALEPISPARLLTPAEVSRMLRIGRGLLAALVRDGNLPSYKIGRLRRFMLADVLAYLGEHRDDGRFVHPDALPSEQRRQKIG
jgi:excisionase family DNA binding protein